MKFSARRSTRLGPSIWQRIATSTLRTVDDAYWSARAASQGETEELTCSGLAYLDRLSRDQ